MEINRLFFALWPTPEIIQSIKRSTDQIKDSINGKVVVNSNWHITLAFLGNIDVKTKACLIEHADQIQCSPFSIEFNQILYFTKAKALCIGVNEKSNNDNLNYLAQECKRIQNECGLKSETRHFKPHITVARKAKAPEEGLIINSIHWHAKDFVLVSSKSTEQGSVYSVLNRWPLMVTPHSSSPSPCPFAL